jgi:general secretion pathway protein K
MNSAGEKPISVKDTQRGVALLAVLWLAVALTFMGMATAHLVRTEAEAVGNQIDSQRGYYLARGGIDAAVDSIAGYSPTPAGQTAGRALQSQFVPGKRWIEYRFSGGSSTVEVMPENAKLNVNLARSEQLAALFAALEVPPIQSQQLAEAIVDWRSPRASTVGSVLDFFYASLAPPYVARHAALEQLEELLPVRGMSRDLFFGRTERTLQGRWRKWPPIEDLLTVEASSTAVNPNFASYEVLRSLPGWNDAMARSVIAARARSPFVNMDELQTAVPGVSAAGALAPVTFSQGPIYTLTATGWVPNSGVRRSVRALVLIDRSLPLYHRVLGWWDDWPTPADLPPERSVNRTSGGSPS